MTDITEHKCGCCEKLIDTDDVLETQECLYKRDIGGYASVMGDGTEWSITLCQQCAKTILGKYMVIHNG